MAEGPSHADITNTKPRSRAQAPPRNIKAGTGGGQSATTADPIPKPKLRKATGVGSAGNYRRPLPGTHRARRQLSASSATARTILPWGVQSDTTAEAPYGPVHHYYHRSGHLPVGVSGPVPRVWAGVTARTCGQLQPAPSSHHAPEEGVVQDRAIGRDKTRVLGPSCECNVVIQVRHKRQPTYTVSV